MIRRRTAKLFLETFFLLQLYCLINFINIACTIKVNWDSNLSLCYALSTQELIAFP